MAGFWSTLFGIDETMSLTERKERTDRSKRSRAQRLSREQAVRDLNLEQVDPEIRMGEFQRMLRHLRDIRREMKSAGVKEELRVTYTTDRGALWPKVRPVNVTNPLDFYS